MFKLFSVGYNSKLAKDVAVFNLPAGPSKSCIGATETCRKVCYANKPYIASISRIKNFREKNFKIARSKEFVKEITRELNLLAIKGISKVRIHESGDFFSQAYLNKWIKIIKMFPNFTFLAYTKSFQLDFSEALKLSNFNLIFSIDKTTKLELPAPHPTAYLLMPDENKNIVRDAVTCTHKSDKHYCGKECNICWNIKKNNIKKIYFSLH